MHSGSLKLEENRKAKYKWCSKVKDGRNVWLVSYLFSILTIQFLQKYNICNELEAFTLSVSNQYKAYCLKGTGHIFQRLEKPFLANLGKSTETVKSTLNVDEKLKQWLTKCSMESIFIITSIHSFGIWNLIFSFQKVMFLAFFFNDKQNPKTKAIVSGVSVVNQNLQNICLAGRRPWNELKFQNNLCSGWIYNS